MLFMQAWESVWTLSLEKGSQQNCQKICSPSVSGDYLRWATGYKKKGYDICSKSGEVLNIFYEAIRTKMM